MNDKIKELYARALSEAGEDGEATMVEAVAELIIRECADACLAATKEESSVHLVSVAYADAVKKHFGVE